MMNRPHLPGLAATRLMFWSAAINAAPFAYVPNEGSGTVSVIDTADNKIIATIAVGQRPWNMAITPDGRKLYVANGRSNSISVIDTVQNTKIRDIAVGTLPWGVVIQ